MTSPFLCRRAHHSPPQLSIRRSYLKMGKRGGKRVSTSDVWSSKQVADTSHCRVEEVAEAVVVGVVSDQFAPTTRKCPEQTHNMSNTTMS